VILFALKLNLNIVEQQKTCLMVYRSAYFSTSAGIAPNVSGLCDGWEFEKQMFSLSTKAK